MLQRFLRLETITYIAFVVFSGAFLILHSLNQSSTDTSLLLYYIQLTGSKTFWIALASLLVFAIRFWISALVALFRGVQPSVVFSFENLEKMFLEVSQFAKNIVILGIPFIAALLILSFALGELNMFNIQQSRLQDELLFQWDVLLTQTFPAFSLASLQYPEWFVSVVIICFSYLASMLVLLAVYLLLARPNLFREAAASFFIGAMIAFVGWSVFPVLSPHGRFIDNVYNLPIPLEAQQYVYDYNPPQQIVVYWEDLNSRLEKVSVLPTTAFPSAHVIWAVILVYYSYRIRKWLVLFSLPFAILSTFGTTLLAAHYFVDIPAGIITGLVSILLVRYIKEKGERTLHYHAKKT